VKCVLNINVLFRIPFAWWGYRTGIPVTSVSVMEAAQFYHLIKRRPCALCWLL